LIDVVDDRVRIVIHLAIGKAFSILNDQKKREQYDQYGYAMEPQYQRTNNGSGRSSSTYSYYDDDEEFSAEEIFNLFFGYSGDTSIVDGNDLSLNNLLFVFVD
jgi:DnaJ-class molecular chaperone